MEQSLLSPNKRKKRVSAENLLISIMVLGVFLLIAVGIIYLEDVVILFTGIQSPKGLFVIRVIFVGIASIVTVFGCFLSFSVLAPRFKKRRGLYDPY